MWFWNWWSILAIALVVVIIGKGLHLWRKRSRRKSHEQEINHG